MITQEDIKRLNALITKIESQVERLENKLKSGGNVSATTKGIV
jgi:polyhydroxyalkanoate synthesis regulator phasin